MAVIGNVIRSTKLLIMARKTDYRRLDRLSAVVGIPYPIPTEFYVGAPSIITVFHAKFHEEILCILVYKQHVIANDDVIITAVPQCCNYSVHCSLGCKCNSSCGNRQDRLCITNISYSGVQNQKGDSPVESVAEDLP